MQLAKTGDEIMSIYRKSVFPLEDLHKMKGWNGREHESMEYERFSGSKGERQKAFLAWMEEKPQFQVGPYRVEVAWEDDEETMEDGRVSEDF